MRRDIEADAARGMMVAFDGPETETLWIVSDGKRHFDIRWSFIWAAVRWDQSGLLTMALVMAVYISSSAGVIGRTGSENPVDNIINKYFSMLAR